jgi:transketolase
MPSWELFLAQECEYKKKVIPCNALKAGVEAACEFGWARILGKDGLFFGVNSFGESAPYGDLYKHFGITAEAIADGIKKKLP